jgi:HNH endonuclease
MSTTPISPTSPTSSSTFAKALFAAPAIPRKRPRLDTSPAITPKLAVPSDLERNVKVRYQNTCVVWGIRTTWLPWQIGNGIETCHIIPKSSYKSYLWEEDGHSELESWNVTNSTANCIAMDSLMCHKFHDNRLLAIHPVGIVFLYSLLLTFNREHSKSDYSFLFH